MSPMDAIKAATATSASILGITDGGVLAVGKSADFFALSGNPLEKITNSKEITLVYKAGEELDRAKLIRSLPAPADVKITKADRVNEAVAEAKDA
jgi:imidazolonepropionase-like amidohydrolase